MLAAAAEQHTGDDGGGGGDDGGDASSCSSTSAAPAPALDRATRLAAFGGAQLRKMLRTISSQERSMNVVHLFPLARFFLF
jgi:hypothetical protein